MHESKLNQKSEIVNRKVLFSKLNSSVEELLFLCIVFLIKTHRSTKMNFSTAAFPKILMEWNFLINTSNAKFYCNKWAIFKSATVMILLVEIYFTKY